MNALVFTGWMLALGGGTAPALPTRLVQQLWLSGGWSVVLASAVLLGLQRVPRTLRLAIVLISLLWCWLPGPGSPSNWLGLAFQTPSVATVWLCGVFACRAGVLGGARTGSGAQIHTPTCTPANTRLTLGLGLAAVLLGWLLLLDTFAVLPWQLYAWGFHPAASAVLVLVGVMPWVIAPAMWRQSAVLWTSVVSVLLFVALRLPSGNVWDAVLDPWLWVLAHAFVVRRLWSSKRSVNSKEASSQL